MILRSISTLKNGIERVMDVHDMHAHNLANVNTIGYKQTKMIFKDIQEVEIQKHQNRTDEYDPLAGPSGAGKLSLGPEVAKMIIDFSQGDFVTTGNKLDFAIHGDGFFAVQGENEELYTRKGNFVIDSQGYLTTTDGQKILNRENNQPIQFDTSKTLADIVIQQDGLINHGKERMGYLKIVDFADKSVLSPVEGAAFTSNGVRGETMLRPDIINGSLESANSSAVETMLKSIEAARSYESMATVMQTTSDTLQKVISQTGRF